jgi:uncharacterized protein (AIM24 family)
MQALEVTLGQNEELFAEAGAMLYMGNASLTGPGHVVLQTLPFSRFANRIAATAGGNRGVAGLGNGILGDIISD